MFEQAFKQIDDVLWKDAGCTSELDHNKALTGDDLRDFVNLKLCPYLHGFKQRASGPNTIEYKIGESIYDGACGSAGFHCESFDYLKASGKLTTKDLKTLQTKTFYGKEKKSLGYVIGIMNMILHGIEAPNIVHTNTLTENLADIQEKDRYDIVMANPPFGGKERPEVQQNFPIRTGETAFLFLQHFIKILRAGGRGGIVIKNTFLSNTDNASVSLRKLLLESCNLHTVFDCPGGTFLGAGVKTVVLFFDKGAPTRKVWFYTAARHVLWEISRRFPQILMRGSISTRSPHPPRRGIPSQPRATPWEPHPRTNRGPTARPKRRVTVRAGIQPSNISECLDLGRCPRLASVRALPLKKGGQR